MDALMKFEQVEMLKEDFEKAVSIIAERLDFWDIQILRKFYVTGKEFPFDTQPYCFPILYRELREAHRLKVGAEALRKRLHCLVRHGFLEKVRKTNPTTYEPIRGKEDVVRAVVMKFFLIHGIQSSFK